MIAHGEWGIGDPPGDGPRVRRWRRAMSAAWRWFKNGYTLVGAVAGVIACMISAVVHAPYRTIGFGAVAMMNLLFWLHDRAERLRKD